MHCKGVIKKVRKCTLIPKHISVRYLISENYKDFLQLGPGRSTPYFPWMYLPWTKKVPKCTLVPKHISVRYLISENYKDFLQLGPGRSTPYFPWMYLPWTFETRVQFWCIFLSFTCELENYIYN